jgi:hypothetical protein
MAKKKRIVVVTTDSTRRGVFSGELVSHVGDVVKLKNARMAVYWSSATHGVLGLAANGPASGSKITPPVLQLEINGVTSIMDMTTKAIQKWEAEPWT